ncbi:hypothetical protein ACFE04_000506 [Oxalis oulophora]
MIYLEPRQAIEVFKRQAKAREAPGNSEFVMKLEAAEAKLHDLKSTMSNLGKEAAAAMSAVEAQQQRLTLQRLIAMIEAERAYHQRVLQILDQLEGEMISERQRIEAPPTPSVVESMSMPQPPAYEEVNGVYTTPTNDGTTDSMGYFLGEVVASYQGESDVELSLAVGDYVVVRKVTNNGWAEGECKGRAGWFPFGYIERRDRVLASKMAEEYSQILCIVWRYHFGLNGWLLILVACAPERLLNKIFMKVQSLIANFFCKEAYKKKELPKLLHLLLINVEAMSNSIKATKELSKKYIVISVLRLRLQLLGEFQRITSVFWYIK